MSTPRSATERTSRKAISEALLAQTMGLNDQWIERWQENGTWREESCAPDQPPEFLRDNLNKDEVEELEHRVDQLVAAGCSRPVVYFCLQQLSPTAEWIRSGGHHVGTPSSRGEDCKIERQKTPVATREDMSSLVANARATRNQIRRFTSSFILMAKASGVALPACLSIATGSVDDALDLLQNSLTWVATIAEAYAAPMAETLLKSKGLLYLTCYVSRHADQGKLRSPKVKSVMKALKKASGDVRARRSVEAPGNVLAELATQAAGKSWSTTELKEKLESFRQDYPRLYRLLEKKLTELHEFASR